MTKKLLCFVFLTVSIFANAQNRYDTPANATFTNTYVPMTHEEMMLRAAAEVYREKRAREDFDKIHGLLMNTYKRNKLDILRVMPMLL